jgi:hypothetical protein
MPRVNKEHNVCSFFVSDIREEKGTLFVVRSLDEFHKFLVSYSDRKNLFKNTNKNELTVTDKIRIWLRGREVGWVNPNSLKYGVVENGTTVYVIISRSSKKKLSKPDECSFYISRTIVGEGDLVTVKSLNDFNSLVYEFSGKHRLFEQAVAYIETSCSCAEHLQPSVPMKVFAIYDDSKAFYVGISKPNTERTNGCLDVWINSTSEFDEGTLKWMFHEYSDFEYNFRVLVSEFKQYGVLKPTFLHREVYEHLDDMVYVSVIGHSKFMYAYKGRHFYIRIMEHNSDNMPIRVMIEYPNSPISTEHLLFKDVDTFKSMIQYVIDSFNRMYATNKD